MREHGRLRRHPRPRPSARQDRTLGRIEESGSRVVADLHENYPMALSFYRRNATRARFERFRFSSRRWRRYERTIVPSCDGVIAVVEEMKTRLVSIGVPAERDLRSWRTTSTLIDSCPIPWTRPARARVESRFVIVHAGVLGRTPRLDVAVRAMQDGRPRGPERRHASSSGMARHRRSWSDSHSELGSRRPCAVRRAGALRPGAFVHRMRAMFASFRSSSRSRPTPASRTSSSNTCSSASRWWPDRLRGRLDASSRMRVVACFASPATRRAFANALLALSDARSRTELGENGRVRGTRSLQLGDPRPDD